MWLRRRRRRVKRQSMSDTITRPPLQKRKGRARGKHNEHGTCLHSTLLLPFLARFLKALACLPSPPPTKNSSLSADAAAV